MSDIAHEIASQPACWRTAVERSGAYAELLPADGERVAAVGCVTSLFVSQAYAALRESAGLGLTDAFAASEYPFGRRYDRVLAISRSGTTTEVVRLMESVPRGTPTLAICAVPGAPVVSSATAAIVLDFADERSVVQTRFATSALALLLAHTGRDLTTAIAHAEIAVSADLPVDPAGFDHWVFLGRGWTAGLANEAALKMREVAGSWAESYPAMEYRHGPISVAGARSVVWAIGDVEPDLLQDVAETGATVVARDHDPMADLVSIQKTAVALAEAKGLDPDHPRHLTRSVVLS